MRYRKLFTLLEGMGKWHRHIWSNLSISSLLAYVCVVCMCVFACVYCECVCAHACSCMCACGGLELILDFFLDQSPFYSLKHGHLLNPEHTILPSLASQLTWGALSLSPNDRCSPHLPDSWVLETQLLLFMHAQQDLMDALTISSVLGHFFKEQTHNIRPNHSTLGTYPRVIQLMSVQRPAI